MADFSLERVPFARATGVRRDLGAQKALRRAALLVGTSLFLHAAPARAINECGPPPPAGGTVTCPAGEYPNGIDYLAPNDLEIRLDGGVVTRGGSTVEVLGDGRFVTSVSTLLQATNPDAQNDALDLVTRDTAYALVYSASATLPGGRGVDVASGGSATVLTGAISTTGLQGDGLRVRAGYFKNVPTGQVANILLSSINLSTTGDSSRGISTLTGNGTIDITSRALATSGRDSVGIESFGARSLTIESGTIGTSGIRSPGIVAHADVVTIGSSIIDTFGDDSFGIEARGVNGLVVNNGNITTRGNGRSSGISAISTNGPVRVQSLHMTTLGSATATASPFGIQAATGSGSVVVVTTFLNTHADRAFGIDARSLVSGSVTIDSNSVVTRGASAPAILAATNRGDVTVRSSAVGTSGANSAGITATAADAGMVTVATEGVTTRVGSSPGIVARSPSGSVVVGDGTVTTTGESSPAVGASAGGDVSVTLSSVTTSGPNSPGITASSRNGKTTVTAGSVVTQGANSGAIDARGRSATVTSTTIATAGSNSPGISVTSGADPLSIKSGSVSTAGTNSTGILASSATGPAEITGGSIVTTGRSRGIEAYTQGGNINIVSGSIVTQGAGTSFEEGAGIYAIGGGDVSIASGSVTTTGTQAFGIRVFGDAVTVKSNSIATTGRLANAIFATGDSIDVTSGPISTLGDSATGVVTFVVGTGTTSVRTGNITTQGFDSYGVIATTLGTGAIAVTGDGTIVTTGGGSPGISAESRGPVTVSANNISASGPGSDAIAVNGSTATVTIRGLVQSSQGFALRGKGGLRQSFGPGGPVTATIAGGGTLRGRVGLTPNADRIVNNGLFDAIGTSQFDAGADLFDNNAGGTVRSVGGTATFAGLETFNNRGLIEMRDGAANDMLVLAGAYAGTGGARLGLDVDFAAGTADRLVTGAATGSTTIEVQGSVGGFTSGILLVDGGAGTSATAFTLAGGTNSAYLTRDLSFDAANNDFLLVQLPGTAVFETARFGRMASQLWYESADAVAAQLDTVRDGNRGRGMALWLQGWTGERERSGTQTLAGAGSFDVSYEQDFHGLQGGLDFQAGSGVVGITGGAGRSDAVFGATGNPVDMEVQNVGLYAQLGSGPLFFNALAKRDWAELEIAPGAGLGAQFDADLFGVQFNAGLRVASGALYAEPSVGISWVQADVDSFESGPASVEPGEVESLRARAGLRLGARVPLAGGTLLPYVAADAYEELGDPNASEFTLGETLRLFDEPAGTRGQAAAGLSFVKAGFEAFVRGEMDFSGGADSKAVRAGARIRF